MRIIIQTWSSVAHEASQIRHEVFIKEQGVPLELELDGLDDSAWHVIIMDDSNPIATARLLLEGRHDQVDSFDQLIGRIGRMAVRTDRRGQGLGHQLLEALIQKGRELGLMEFYLHAQVSAQGFYEKHGFVAEGELFEEASIVHQAMRLKI